MKVCLCKGITVWDMKAEDIVKDYLLFETEQNIDIGIPFKHKGKCYSSGLIMPKEKIVIAEEFQEKEEPKNTRVFSLARDLGVGWKKVKDVANKLGIGVSVAQAGLTDAEVKKITEEIEE